MMQENVFGQIVSFGVPLTLNHYAENSLHKKGHNLPLSRARYGTVYCLHFQVKGDMLGGG